MRVLGARGVARAELLAVDPGRLRTGNPGPLPSPEEAMVHDWSPAELQVEQSMASKMTAGTPDQVRDDLERRAREADADEVMLVTPIHDVAERRRSYELVAQAFGVSGPAVTNAPPSLAQV